MYPLKRFRQGRIIQQFLNCRVIGKAVRHDIAGGKPIIILGVIEIDKTFPPLVYINEKDVLIGILAADILGHL